VSGPLHFHAVYGEHEAIIHIRELRVTCGTLPRRALAMVLEWAVEHRQALLEDWDLCSQLTWTAPPERYTCEAFSRARV
jgi:hypothetical protein